MLLRFSVNNFLSISEELDFQLFPYSRLREKRDHIYQTPEIDLLKSAAIYGANGSGKSNFIKATAYLRDFVINNTIALNGKPPEAFRLDKEYLNVPSRFEVEVFAGGKYYHYGVALKSYFVEEEFLHEISPKRENSEALFTRKRTETGYSIFLHPRFLQSEKDKARATIYQEELLKNTESFLHLLGNNEAFADMRTVLDWFTAKLIVIQPHMSFLNLCEALHDNKDLTRFAGKLLRSLDTGVDDIGLYGTNYETYFGLDEPERKQQILTELNSGKPYVKVYVNNEMMLAKLRKDKLMVFRVATHHKVGDEKGTMFYPNEESDGTRRILDFLPLWALVINTDATLIIDEIGRSLHPNLVEQLLRLFMTTKTKGQLIFTTHEASLLQQDIFRRDEVWMMQKTAKGNSEIVPLSDFNIRNDLDLRKGYLNGRFGGVPHLKHLFPEDFVTNE